MQGSDPGKVCCQERCVGRQVVQLYREGLIEQEDRTDEHVKVWRWLIKYECSKAKRMSLQLQGRGNHLACYYYWGVEVTGNLAS